MKATKPIIVRLIVGCVLALGLNTNLHAESYYYAKDPDQPPLPFNRHPELPVVEIEKGKFLVDDRSIPDTPEKAEARATRQDAARTASTTDPLAEQARQRAIYASNYAGVLPLVHRGYGKLDGTPAHFQEVMDQRAMALSKGAGGMAEAQRSALEAALAWAAEKGVPPVITNAGEIVTATLMEIRDGVPLFYSGFAVEAAQTISTDRVWPGGSTGYNLTGTNRTISMWDQGSPKLDHPSFYPLGEGHSNGRQHHH